MPTQLHKSIDTITKHLEMIENQDLDRLDFEWNGMPFSALIENKKASTLITIKGKLGRIYYTVENANKRKTALTQYYTSKRSKHRPFKLVNKHEIHFKEITQSRSKLDSSGVMSAITMILLDLNASLQSFTSNLKPLH